MTTSDNGHATGILVGRPLPAGRTTFRRRGEDVTTTIPEGSTGLYLTGPAARDGRGDAPAREVVSRYAHPQATALFTWLQTPRTLDEMTDWAGAHACDDLLAALSDQGLVVPVTFDELPPGYAWVHAEDDDSSPRWVERTTAPSRARTPWWAWLFALAIAAIVVVVGVKEGVPWWFLAALVVPATAWIARGARS